MSRFSSIRSSRPPVSAEPQEALAPPGPTKPRGRSGKKAVSGYFSPELSRALHLLALENGSNLQALMGEAFDDLMRKYGKHPFGER